MRRKRKATEEVKTPQSGPEQEAAGKCHEWLTTIDRPAKQFYMDEMDEVDKLYRNEHWDLLGPNGEPLRTTAKQAKRPNAVENITFALIDGEVCEFARNVDLVDFPIDPEDEQAAQVYTDLKKFVADKNGMDEERLSLLTNFFWHGTAVFETTWDPLWMGGKGPNRWVGDIRWRHVHPRAIFPDARCGEDINKGTRIHTASWVTVEYIKSRYGKDVQGDAGMNDGIETSNNEVVSASGTDPLGRVLLVGTWYKGEPLVGDKNGDGMHVMWWCGEAQPTYLKHANYVYFDADESDPKFPFHFRQRHKRDGSCWGYGDAVFLKSVQIIHNKTVEMLIEGHVMASMGRTYFEPGAVDEKQQKEMREKGTLAGMHFAVNDVNRIKPVFPQGMPGSVVEEANRLPKAMEQIVGRPDVTQGRNPGSVTAFAALNLLAQRARVRAEKADVAITSLWRDCGKYINRLINGNYTEGRTYRLIGKDQALDKLVMLKRGVFRRDDFRRVQDFNTGGVSRLAEFTPPEGYVEGTDYEVYDPELDVRCATTQQMPSDRMFYIDMAMKLLQTQSIDLVTFYSVIELGRFPTWQEMQTRAASQQQTQQQPTPMAVPNVGQISFSLASKDPAVVYATLQQLLQGQQGGGDQPNPEAMAQFKDAVSKMSPQDAQTLMAQLEQLSPDQQEEFAQQIGSGVMAG